MILKSIPKKYNFFFILNYLSKRFAKYSNPSSKLKYSKNLNSNPNLTFWVPLGAYVWQAAKFLINLDLRLIQNAPITYFLMLIFMRWLLVVFALTIDFCSSWCLTSCLPNTNGSEYLDDCIELFSLAIIFSACLVSVYFDGGSDVFSVFCICSACLTLANVMGSVCFNLVFVMYELMSE